MALMFFTVAITRRDPLIFSVQPHLLASRRFDREMRLGTELRPCFS